MNKRDQTRLMRAIDAIEAPEGWSRTALAEGEGVYSVGSYKEPSTVSVVFERADGKAKAIIRYALEHNPKTKAGKRVAASGTTCYTNHNGVKFCCDRRGVDDSFYVGEYGYTDGTEALAAQAERVTKAQERGLTLVLVPGLDWGWRLSPERLEQHKATLQAGGRVAQRPSGFGTGHNLTVKCPRGAWRPQQVKPETAAFFGVKSLWVESFDCD